MTPPERVSTIGRWWPVLLWAGVILSASSVPGSTLDDVGLAIPDKIVHGVEYAVLGFLACRALQRDPNSGRLRSVGLAVLLAALAGLLDENYQRLIPLRDTSAADWVADVAGAALGAAVGALILSRSGGDRRRLR